MKHSDTDIKFLNEFSSFSCKCSLTIAKSLHSSYYEYINKKEYDFAAHCLIKLNCEMITLFELFSALLYSFSKWEQKGILNTLLTYNIGDIRPFIKKLIKSDDSLKQICFPTKEDLIKITPVNAPKDYSKYNLESFKEGIDKFVRMYTNPSILDSYHKVKHGSLIIRDPSFALPTQPLPIGDCDHIYIVRKIDGEIAPIKFSVLGSKAEKLADDFLHNVKETTKMISKSAGAVAFYLERSLMQQSNNE